MPRNFLRGPNFQQFDIVFNKRIQVFRDRRISNSGPKIFNVFNHTNFDIPGSRLNLALPTVTLAGGVYTVTTEQRGSAGSGIHARGGRRNFRLAATDGCP